MSGTLQRLERLGRAEKARVNDRQVKANLRRAGRDLDTARKTLDVDEEWAFTISYHAMLRAGRALMFSMGWRPKGREQHKTVVEFCADVLGDEFKNLTDRFDRMRRKRNDFIYEPERPIPRTEAEQSLESAQKFVGQIREKIAAHMPQLKLL
jgi:uncharacterized protein (UPF0332 family)